MPLWTERCNTTVGCSRNTQGSPGRRVPVTQLFLVLWQILSRMQEYLNSKFGAAVLKLHGVADP